ncbi:MAG TPA: alpha/beta hydrolase [Edaphobacter sp.]|nr:alpha/beta hydrolase [Edaphobacter sp.]
MEDSLSGAPEAKLAWPNEGMLEDISAAAVQIQVPTIVLAGELDNLDSVEQHRREVIARIPGAKLQVISGSGHLLPIDEPVRTAEAIRRFVQEDIQT